MRVHETIHHGDYYNERVVAATATDCRAMFVTIGITSPYPFDFDPDHNRFHAEALATFERTGECEIGWARYRTEREEAGR